MRQQQLSYSTTQAAEQTGLTGPTIIAAIKTGKLRAKASDGINEKTGRIKGRYLIRHDDLVAWLDGLDDA